MNDRSLFIAYALDRQDLAFDLDRHIRDSHAVNVVLMADDPHRGRSLPEKFEDVAGQCEFGVFLLTKDDELTTKAGREWRARQNVILELGYFWGKLGRGSLAILVEAGMSLPTDTQVGYIGIIDDLGTTKLELDKEVRAWLEAASKPTPVTHPARAQEAALLDSFRKFYRRLVSDWVAERDSATTHVGGGAYVLEQGESPIGDYVSTANDDTVVKVLNQARAMLKRLGELGLSVDEDNPYHETLLAAWE